MRKYVQVSKTHYLDKEALKLVTKSDLVNPNIVFVPPFIPFDTAREIVGFSMKGTTVKDLYNIYESINHIVFKNWSIEFNSTGNYTVSYRDTNSLRTISMFIQVFNFHYLSKADSFNYNILLACGNSQKVILHSSSHASQCFKPLQYLEKQSNKALDGGVLELPVGLSKKKYDILLDDCLVIEPHLVLSLGTWGVILNDDLSFNSVIIFSKITERSVSIHRILLANDVRMMKLMFLMQN